MPPVVRRCLVAAAAVATGAVALAAAPGHLAPPPARPAAAGAGPDVRPALPRSRQQQYRASIDLVHLPVTVLAKDGGAVRGLTADDFEIYEDGRRQRISYFDAGGTPAGDALPLHLGLLLDASESMEQDLRTASNAAVRFIDQLPQADDVTFVDFDTGIRISRFSPASYPMLFERIRDRRAGGGTALYDALYRYVLSTFARPGQHIVLLHSDGGDSTSHKTFGDLQTLLREADVVVYAIGYMQNQVHGTGRIQQQMRVTQIARETGGDAYFPRAGDDIDDLYEKIRAEIAARYTLGYVSSNPHTDDGRFHKVEVRLARPDLRDAAHVRTRSGYRIPSGPGGR